MPNIVHSAPGVSLNRRAFLTGAVATMATPALGAAAALDITADNGRLDAFLKEQLRNGAFPGMAVGIARAGKVVLTRGYGFANVAQRRPVTTDTMFHLASVTKTVTATAIMMLVEAGRIELDAPVNRYLDFEVLNPAHPHAAITARHLLMHVSGISDETYYKVDFRTVGKDSSLPLGTFLKDYLLPDGRHYSVTGSFSPAAPGANYDYCNVGYALLGYLVERVADEDLRVFTQARMFDPLGMRQVSWTIAGVPKALMATPYDIVDDRIVPTEPVGFPDFPVGMLRASIAGFMPFVAAAANRGAAGPAQILTATDQAEMLTMHVPQGLPDWVTGQGLGWMESSALGKRRINHWGGDPGVFTAVYLDPASTTGVAIFTNGSATPASKTAIKAIAERLLTGPLA
ncbi:serine hydrolase domain-containing protein [Novosphingobium sp. RL4]|uniref:serine hydrolase domain-containing protein n=1 Tax=Novosphingobium sp. RL4 TaxID=3109595 RepID=UPI002D768CE3|nr:serine hydrolase domain-containing protein [Novosphingobium sp. RL4]WRT95285.1 serine hydrolase domain-containing protein [Novosphingobium sp. RL4]